MNTFLILFLLATCSSLALTPLVRRVCERWDLLDQPRDQRRIHRKAVPRLGGVSIVASMCIAFIPLLFIDNYITRSLKASKLQLLAVLLPALLVFLFGVYDDLKESRPYLKFITQGLAGVLFFALGGRVEALSVPFIGRIALAQPVSFILTVLWVVAISNAFNLIDGIDGLAAGAALFASFVMLVLAIIMGNPYVAVITVILSGSLIGFLRYNFNPASIFLGDSGALFIGFVLASVSVQGTQKASTAIALATPLLAFGVPIVDTSLAILRRFIGDRPLFEGDREHIHHMLLARGWSQRRVAVVLYGACATFGLLSLLFVADFGGRTTGLVLFIVSVAVIFVVGRLRYHEVDEIKASMRRNVMERRRRGANNVRVRRASRAMSNVRTLAELFDVLQDMLEPGEFVYATVRLGSANKGYSPELILAAENGARSLRRAEIRGGMIFWTWERGDIKASEIVGSFRFWSLRLPLVTEQTAWGYVNLYRETETEALLLDVNYLFGLFPCEMSRAVERVFTQQESETCRNQTFGVVNEPQSLAAAK